MIFRSIHVAENDIISLFFMAEQYSNSLKETLFKVWKISKVYKKGNEIIFSLF